MTCISMEIKNCKQKFFFVIFGSDMLYLSANLLRNFLFTALWRQDFPVFLLFGHITQCYKTSQQFFGISSQQTNFLISLSQLKGLKELNLLPKTTLFRWRVVFKLIYSLFTMKSNAHFISIEIHRKTNLKKIFGSHSYHDQPFILLLFFCKSISIFSKDIFDSCRGQIPFLRVV